MSAVYEAVSALSELGVNVLSPADPRVVDQIGEFVFVASDRVRSIKMVQDRHLECLKSSDFLWVVAPDGYVGQSASMELGYAVAHDVPVFSDTAPADGTLTKYVTVVDGISAVPSLIVAQAHAQFGGFLVDPREAVVAAHHGLDRLTEMLSRPQASIRDLDGERILAERANVASILLPSRPRREGSLRIVA
jgi:hypothetical protein